MYTIDRTRQGRDIIFIPWIEKGHNVRHFVLNKPRVISIYFH